MPETAIEIKGLEEIISKLRRMPREVDNATRNAMDKSLLALWENVPPYPPNPADSEYRRTMTLAGSLGSSPGGGKGGAKPTVYSVTGSGGNLQGRFGTDLSYAQYVIDPQRQAYMHRPGYKGRQGWWTMETIKERAKDKIERLWNTTIKLIIQKLGL
jgi:hypothetical protein